MDCCSDQGTILHVASNTENDWIKYCNHERIGKYRYVEEMLLD